MPSGHQSCSDLNTESSMFTPDDSTSAIAKTSLETKTKTLNVILENCNVVLVSQVEQIQPMESEVNSEVPCFKRPAVSEEESQQKSTNLSGEILLVSLTDRNVRMSSKILSFYRTMESFRTINVCLHSSFNDAWKKATKTWK